MTACYFYDFLTFKWLFIPKKGVNTHTIYTRNIPFYYYKTNKTFCFFCSEKGFVNYQSQQVKTTTYMAKKENAQTKRKSKKFSFKEFIDRKFKNKEIKNLNIKIIYSNEKTY
jgi:hypothetical protein